MKPSHSLHRLWSPKLLPPCALEAQRRGDLEHCSSRQRAGPGCLSSMYPTTVPGLRVMLNSVCRRNESELRSLALCDSGPQFPHTMRCLDFTNSVKSIAPHPFSFVTLCFPVYLGHVPSQALRKDLRAAGLGFNTPWQRPRPRLGGPPPWLSPLQTRLSSHCPGCAWGGRHLEPTQCLPVGAGE